MLTATFMEDAVRIITEFTPQATLPLAFSSLNQPAVLQLNFLVASRGCPTIIAYFVLVFSVVMQIGGSVSIIAQLKTPIAVGGLIGVIFMQASTQATRCM